LAIQLAIIFQAKQRQASFAACTGLNDRLFQKVDIKGILLVNYFTVYDKAH